MIGCPVGSIRRRETLEIVIEDWCIGCGLCAKSCPYGNINMHQIGEAGEEQARPKQKAITCDLCAGLKEPSCVYACPHEAALRVDPRAFFGEGAP
jgi:Fe-S-cluster-containing hydrogenase component 2